MVRTIGRPFLFLAFLSFGMARHGSKLPLPLQAALAGAIRSALAFPTLCGINGIADFAADLGRTRDEHIGTRVTEYAAVGDGLMQGSPAGSSSIRHRNPGDRTAVR